MELSPQRRGVAWGHVAAGLLACAVVGGCGARGTGVAATNAAAAWAPERISEDPEGYLQYVTRTIQTRIAERQTKLQSIAARQSDVDARFAAFAAKCADLENLAKRIRDGYRRAEEEDRWPFVAAGRSFDRAKADEVLAVIQRTLDTNRPLLTSYQDAARRLALAGQTLRSDVENLTRMGEKVAVDRERVRINKGMTELAALQKTETELASFSQVLVDMCDDVNSGVLATTDAAQRTMDVDRLLK